MGNKLQRACCRTYSVDFVANEVAVNHDAFKEIPIDLTKHTKNDPILVSKKDLNTNEFVPLAVQMIAMNRVEKISKVVIQEPQIQNTYLNEFDRIQLDNKYDDYSRLDHFKIDLKSMMIDSIHSDTFSNITNLTEIDLSENNLNEIDTNLFKGLFNLKVINLSHNKLKHLDASVFQGLISLEVIDLSFNLLEELNMKLFDGLISLKKIVLNGNNWKLDKNNNYMGMGSNTNISGSSDTKRRNSHIYYFYNPIDLQSIGADVDIRIYDFVTKIDDSRLNK